MKKIVTVFVLLVFSISSWASCFHLYPQNFPQVNKTELCNLFYVVQYDQVKNRPIVVSERLIKNDVNPRRINAFKSDRRLLNGPQNSDYVGSGFDRGHLAPAADAMTDTEMVETFLLSNMTPQEPTLNRASWRELEEHVRSYVNTRSGFVYVVTIPVYGGNIRYMKRIPVPSGYWKIVISNNTELYYYADNKQNAQVKEYKKIDWRKIVINNL
jgi:endonuclease G